MAVLLMMIPFMRDRPIMRGHFHLQAERDECIEFCSCVPCQEHPIMFPWQRAQVARPH